MKIITISGLDGSGKSTQIQLLKKYLESQGRKVFYFHAGNFSIANKILGAKKDSSGKEISVSKAGWLKIFLRKIALFIDLWRFKKLFKNLEKDGYDYILSDRYFYDTIININYLSCHCEQSEAISEFNALNSRLPRRYTPRNDSIIKPNIAIYLKTDPEKIMRRERTPDQGLAYLQKKKELYDAASQDWNLKIIDGNRNKEEIFEEIYPLTK